jgi:hypothetical protein
MGPRGPRGERGEPGVNGLDGEIDTYAYLYTTEPLDGCAPVDFDRAGAIAGGIAPHGRKVVLEESADYAIWFSANAQEADCVELKQNCHTVAGGTYAKSGMAIIRAEAFDELSVVVSGHCSCGPDCGCEAVNASLLILKLGPKKMHCTHQHEVVEQHCHHHEMECGHCDHGHER